MARQAQFLFIEEVKHLAGRAELPERIEHEVDAVLDFPVRIEVHVSDLVAHEANRQL